MRIVRHPINEELAKTLFHEERERLLPLLECARKATRALSPLVTNARIMYQTGGVVAPHTSEVGYALRLSAQANTAILVFSHNQRPPQSFLLGNGPPVSYSEPVDESHAHVGRWIDALELATITRQTDLLTTLKRLPNELLERSSTVGARSTYLFVSLLRTLGARDPIIGHPAFNVYQEYCANCHDDSAHCIAIRHLAIPFLGILRQLECADAAAFSNSLVGALEMHKKYWGSSEKRRKDFDGFVSLQLTAVAALAWDRGLRFDVESDYIPTSWVRGELFSHGSS